MIVSLNGKLIKKEPTSAIIDVSGVGYQCHISTNTYDSLPNPGEMVQILTYFHVTENNQELFGFYKETERDLFKMLISVSGIGPKTGISLVSAVSPDDFKRRLIAGEVAMLTSLPGIGPKTARRIIVELKDKFVKLAEDDLPIEESGEVIVSAKEAYDALVTLGFHPQSIRNILRDLTNENSKLSTEDLIKKALTKLR
jgi:holliday junction DNA helicase RuvA